MSRLPDLERALHDAAVRQECPAPTTRWWHRGRMVVLAAGATLALSGVALAASGVLDTGEGVPATERPIAGLGPLPSTEATRLAALRTPDPDGGLPWGLVTFEPGPAGVTCMGVGRVQNGQIGVVGRDGAFGDDGRFHPLAPASDQGFSCGGRQADGSFFAEGDIPPFPASGYTGAPGPPIGGCRERVDLDGPTVSPQTRRRLQGVPVCAASSLRLVKFGFAGPDARRATFEVGDQRRTQDLRPQDDGAYLFVLRPTDGRQSLTITYAGGECTITRNGPRGTSSPPCQGPR